MVSKSVRRDKDIHSFFCFRSRMKWKKDNNFKSLNDPHVKLEANATTVGHNNDTSWSTRSNVKKENHQWK